MAVHLVSKEKSAEINADLKAGKLTPKEIADKHGITLQNVYQRRSHQGLSARKRKAAPTHEGPRPNSPENRIDMVALRKDIEAGELNENQIRLKYRIGYKSMRRLKREVRTGKAEPEPANGHTSKLSSEAAGRICEMLGRLAERYPEVFEELEIVQRLARKHPNILTEVM